MVDFNIRVIVDPSRGERGIRRIRSELQQTENAGVRLGRVLSGIFSAAALGAGITQTIRTLASFEQTLATVRGITGATEAQFVALREEAQRLGATTRFSGTEAGEGLIFLSRAGFTAEESIAVLEPTLRLAQAGALGLGEAADISTNVLAGFGLQVDQATRVVDILALTSNSANTNVSQLGQALSFVAPVAASLGVSIEETSAAIGVLSDAGIQSTRAGTGLRRVLSSLINPTGEAADLIRSFGLNLEDVNPQTVGLSTAITRLRDAGVSASDAFVLFGDRGGPAFEVLARGIPRVVELTEELNNSEGTAQELADALDDNLNGALLRVRSAFEAVILALGDIGATDLFRGIFEQLAVTLRGIADNIDEVLIGLRTFATVAGTVLAVQVIPSLLRQILLLNIAIIANPIGALTAGVIAATAALVTFGNQIRLTGTESATAFDFIVVAGERLLDVLIAVFTQGANLLTDFQGDLRQLDFVEVLNNAARFADNVVGIFRGLVLAGAELGRNLPAAIGDALISGLNDLVRSVNQFTNRIITEFNRLPNVTIPLFETTADAIPNVFAGTGTRILEEISRGVVESRQVNLFQNAIADIVEDAETRALERLGRRAAGDAGAAVVDAPAVAEVAAPPDLPTEEIRQFTESQQRVLDNLRLTQMMVADDQEALNQLYADGVITLEEFNFAQRELNVIAGEFNNTFIGGLQLGLDRVSVQLNDFGLQVSDVIVGAFDQASNAVVEFARTGELSVSSFFSSIFEQLLRLSTNQIFAQLVSGIGGGGFGGIFGGIGGLLGFQNGGSFNVGGSGGPDSQVVAFRASPNERVTVQTPSQQRQDTPVVNVQPQNIRITNVLSRDEMLDDLESSAGEERILNVIERNRSDISRILGG